MPLDEQIAYNQLDGNAKAVWSLLLASGYLKVVDYERYVERDGAAAPVYEKIEEKCYEQVLTAKGIGKDHIRKYGFAFEGKHVLIGR